MPDKATLCIGDQKIELPVIEGTEGERAIDVSRLRDTTGLITYDPSLSNTAVCKSAITFIDGDQGILRYRGIPIEQFTQSPNFLEVAWLLIFGRLPNAHELQRFSNEVTAHELLHEGLVQQLQHMAPDAPPMAQLSAALNHIVSFDKQFASDASHSDDFETIAAQLISKIRTMAAFMYRRAVGLPAIYPDPKLSYCANFLHMMFSVPYQQYDVTQEAENALNQIFILHADHEQNCSTATARVVGSSQANLFASCSAAVCALWGPLHGGANMEVVEMLERILQGGMSPEDCVRAAKDKSNPFKLYGFGHRVYKNYDPRAKIIKQVCDSLLAKMKRSDKLLDIARKLEELALNDSYFVDRKLYPNVDFYSGIILRALGVPTNMFTVCFAIGRLPGWIAQWKEQHEDPTGRILRPRQVYIGNRISDYVPLENRT